MGPRRLLLNDEGNSALHFVDLDVPAAGWTHRAPGRDLQLVGAHRVLRSAADGFVELDLAAQGAVVRRISIADLPGAIESARRLPDGNTVVLGNGRDGIFVWQVDPAGRPIHARSRLCAGLEKGRLLRRTGEGTFLFCSDTEGRHLIHELDWQQGTKELFEVPPAVPADSMVKAVRTGPGTLAVSTGYAASLLRVDLVRGEVTQILGGKEQAAPAGARRPVSPFFFSGYQMFADGSFLVANWQGHSAACNAQGYQVLMLDAGGALIWMFDQARYPQMSSLNNVIALDGLDTSRLHDEPNGVLVPIG